MHHRHRIDSLFAAVALWITLAPASLAADYALVAGSETRLPVTHRDGQVFLPVDAVAEAFGWEIKIQGDLLVACRGDVCVPLRITDANHLRRDGQRYMEFDALAAALRFASSRTGEVTVLQPLDAERAAPLDKNSTAYHDPWGQGRGFEEGETLPDVPLYDMQGNEVRFGEFLGKKYILYGWASW